CALESSSPEALSPCQAHALSSSGEHAPIKHSKHHPGSHEGQACCKNRALTSGFNLSSIAPEEVFVAKLPFLPELVVLAFAEYGADELPPLTPKSEQATLVKDQLAHLLIISPNAPPFARS